MIRGDIVDDLASRVTWRVNIGAEPYIGDDEFVLVRFKDQTYGYGIPASYYNWQTTNIKAISQYAVVTAKDLK